MKASNMVDVAVAKDLKEAKREDKEEKKSDKEETKVLNQTPAPEAATDGEKKKKEGSVSEPAKLPSKEKLVEKTEKAQKTIEKESVKAKKAENEVKSLKPAVEEAKQ